MKTSLKELIWLVAMLVVALLTYQLILGNTALDIGMHDTYVNGGDNSKPSVAADIFVFFISFSFLVYLIRGLLGRFKSITVNLILIVITGIAIFHFSSNVIFYTTTTGSNSTGVFMGYAPGFLILYRVLKIFLILTLAATAFMTGRNFKSEVIK